MMNQSISNKNMVSHANMSRLLKQMSLIVSTELQQIAIDLVERLDEDKLVKFIRLKEEFRHTGMNMQSHQMCHQSQMTQKYSSIANKLSNSNSILLFFIKLRVILCKNSKSNKIAILTKFLDSL